MSFCSGKRREQTLVMLLQAARLKTAEEHFWCSAQLMVPFEGYIATSEVRIQPTISGTLNRTDLTTAFLRSRRVIL